MAAKNQENYDMSHARRGHLLIISNETFDGHDEKRTGTKLDEERLRKTFEEFGFEVTAKNDLTAKEMLTEINNVAEKPQSDCDCLAIAILTNPDPNNDEILGKDCKSISLDDIIAPLKKNVELVGKPKLIFIQAGPPAPAQVDHGINQSDSASPVGAVPPSLPTQLTVPVMADFLYYYTYDFPTGYKEWIFADSGSIFIQKLCCVLDDSKSSKEKNDGKTEEADLFTLLMNANTEISYINESAAWPVIESQLTKKIFLSKGSKRSNDEDKPRKEDKRSKAH